MAETALVTPEVVTPPAPVAAPPSVDPAIQAQLDELKFAAQYWREKAESTKPEPVKPKESPSAEVDPLDVLAREGAAGFKKLLNQEGFVSRAEVDALVAQKAAELTTSDQLKKQYPELDDQNSAFFKEASPRYREYVDRGYSRTEALKAAARDTELDQLKSGKRETPKAREDRESREQAQRKTDAGKGRSADPAEDDNEELNDTQKRMCEAFGISEENYVKRAKAGVRIQGLPDRRGR